jgi:Arc/MetJ family transcription regulator
MKTTVEIDQSLLEEVQKLLKTGTIRDTVHQSMEFVRRQTRLRALADALGSIDLDLTPASLRRQRGKRTGRGPR